MKKNNYIQPEMAVELLHMEAMMLPSSPTGGDMDPQQPNSNPAPKRRVFF